MPGMTTLPSLLRRGGYRMIHAVKTHFGPVGSFGELPQKFGFDINIAGFAYGNQAVIMGPSNLVMPRKGGKSGRFRAWRNTMVRRFT